MPNGASVFTGSAAKSWWPPRKRRHPAGNFQLRTRLLSIGKASRGTHAQYRHSGPIARWAQGQAGGEAEIASRRCVRGYGLLAAWRSW